MADNSVTTSDGTNELPELEKTCSQCDGRGCYGYGSNCDICDGTGWELTDAGEKILSMIRCRFGILFRSYMNDR